MADNDLVLIIWRDACFREQATSDTEFGCGVLRGTVGVIVANNKAWLHIEQDINFERPERKRHVYSIPKANIVEIVRTQFRARLRFWRKQGMEE